MGAWFGDGKGGVRGLRSDGVDDVAWACLLQNLKFCCGPHSVGSVSLVLQRKHASHRLWKNEPLRCIFSLSSSHMALVLSHAMFFVF